MSLRHIDEPRLEQDLGYRVGYLTEFMQFGVDEIDAIQATAPYLGPLVPVLVDAVYDKLAMYDATWRHFARPQHGYQGALPTTADDLAMDADVIQFRKQHLGRYLTRLVTEPYDARMLSYLDQVGKMHTFRGGKGGLQVPLVQMNALMGFVADALTATIFGFNLDRNTEVRTIRAFQKLLWIQNDLINRHYTASGYQPV